MCFSLPLLQADNMASSSITTGTIGFPRIGPNREMKKALERYTVCNVQSNIVSVLTMTAVAFVVGWH